MTTWTPDKACPRNICAGLGQSFNLSNPRYNILDPTTLLNGFQVFKITPENSFFRYDSSKAPPVLHPVDLKDATKPDQKFKTLYCNELTIER